MITIKKRNLIFLLVVVLVAGGILSGSYIKARSVINDNVGISLQQYEEYKSLKTEYGDIDALKQLIEEKYYVPVDADALGEGMRKGLFWGIGDPYSSYLSKSEYEALLISTSGEYQGIGVTIAPDDKGFINVVAPMDGTPAYKAGIQPGDKVVFVDGEEYSANTIDAAANAMRGKEGTKVEVGIFRDGERIDLTIIRANILLETVRSEIIEGDIGYIRVSSFEERTSSDFADALRDMELSGVKGLVIDLRDNPGGLVDAAVNIADQLLETGVVTYTENRQGEKEYLKSKAGATKLPYILLVNGGSASASEIIAGAIKDADTGLIVGTTTYGKGIIQEIVPLDNGDATKLTIMQYFSPKGDIIHKVGVTPDLIVELTEDDYTDGRLERENDRQLAKAVELLRNGEVTVATP